MTPFEAFHGKEPNVKNLRAFGCVSFAHNFIAKSERKKLDVVARQCVLVGYGTEVKGYRLFDPDRSKVFYSRDVKFNELEFGLKECRDVEPVGYFEVVDDGGVLEEIGAEETMPDQVVTETEPRRSQRIRHRPNYYAEGVFVVTDMLTKGLSCVTFELLRKMAGIVSLPVSFLSK